MYPIVVDIHVLKFVSFFILQNFLITFGRINIVIGGKAYEYKEGAYVTVPKSM